MQKKSNLFFQSLRNIVYFFKIIVVLLVLLYFLYWIQHLTGDIWDWTKFTHSLFKFLVNFASKISSKSILLFDAEFNYSFFIVFIFFTLLYGLIVLIYDGINVLEENYNNFLRAIRKRQENSYNQGLSKINESEQKKLNNYYIYLQTFVKPKYSHKEFNIDMNEQNRILIKFLQDKFEILPEKYEEGFLFTFNNFNKVDQVVEIFNRLPLSQAPIEYLMCLQIETGNYSNDMNNIKKMINLKMLNKITLTSDTVFRYNYNDFRRNETVQLGIYQNDNNNTYEVYEFVRKNK